MNNALISISYNENLTDEQLVKVCGAIKKHFNCWGFNDFDFNPIDVRMVNDKMIKVKCSFCEATTYFGEKAVEQGWGRARGNINQIKLNIIHCPKHYKEAYDSLRDIGQIASTGSSKNGN